ncbi:YggS family pyridoxal phosphate-dependent enzyme [Marinitoga litoralis]|uniref:YggS family pyridoxal phosphate-dependent enzyme n=1 Tax=Marinitoga litoralis TaxID=570855 RepID=UPI001961A40A|nr:YggS family pyridoxal phosphate-dependent enzyme [Marinitoga litoralis]MBM7558875.1 pyridoxal phosphate enzyme (YggS family) [Marinitoga litoralis]
MDFIKKNLSEIQNKIKLYASNRNDILLIAVSKTFPIEYIKEAYDFGIRDFAENKAQELRYKAQELSDLDINWHFIGRIQTNKIKYIVPVAKYIHSVYREKEIEEIDKVAKKYNKIQKILIELNVSGEESKGGITENELKDLLEFSKQFENVQVVGLMTMAPYTDNEEIIRNVFLKLKSLRDEYIKYYPNLKELSMGMSNDYHIAIEAGSTMLRIGSSIFGNRNYSTGG